MQLLIASIKPGTDEDKIAAIRFLLDAEVITKVGEEYKLGAEGKS